MAYKTRQAIATLKDYMNHMNMLISPITNTKDRGYVALTRDGDQFVYFVYPLVHKQDNTKNYFDTRDSGAAERNVAWQYAQRNGLKYFCLGVNDQVDKYRDYIFSLECDEARIESISGTRNGSRNGPGNQIIIPNDYEPDKSFERIKNRLGVYISVVHRDALQDYIEKYDNRPYMQNTDAEAEADTDDSSSAGLCFNTSLTSSFSRNRIVFGAPGTGKSYMVNQDRAELLGSENETDYERVTFHPDYSYANFVGTYKPVPCKDENGEESISYRYVPGPFMRVYVKALRNGRTADVKPFLLIIEEINRAEVAAVFGDIFQLLDRDENEVSEYPIQASEDIKNYLADELGGEPDDYSQIRIPDNMFIWATMNSADQGVFPMDTAFKRRWDFTYIGIDDNDEEIRGKTVVIGSEKPQRIEWNKLRKAVNRFLARQKINEDKQLGPYFISRKIIVPADGNEIDSKRFTEAFKNKVLMYLFEDAARQKRPALFEGCFQNSSRYSEICREFEQKGIRIFNHEIQQNTDPEDLPDSYSADSSTDKETF